MLFSTHFSRNSDVCPFLVPDYHLVVAKARSKKQVSNRMYRISRILYRTDHETCHCETPALFWRRSPGLTPAYPGRTVQGTGNLLFAREKTTKTGDCFGKNTLATTSHGFKKALASAFIRVYSVPFGDLWSKSGIISLACSFRNHERRRATHFPGKTAHGLIGLMVG